MNRVFAAIVFVFVGSMPALGAELPTWAYPVSPPAPPAPPETGIKIKISGSTQAFTLTEILDRFNVADWYPGEHPKMPPVVARGRNPMRACGYCHTPGGAGRPENAGLAGLTPAYFKQQVHNFRDGKRQGSESSRNRQNLMIEIAKLVTDAEIDEAAAYYASLKPISYVRVVESATAPRTFVTGSILARLPEGGTEPLGARIIEVPASLEQFESGGKTIACALCHGADLKGAPTFRTSPGVRPAISCANSTTCRTERAQEPQP